MADQASTLDRIRINYGNETCKAVFYKTFRSDLAKAMDLINDKRNTFPCLYLMQTDIEALALLPYLSPQNMTAFHIIRQISNPQDNGINLSARNGTVYPVLKWIFDTGTAEDCKSNAYEQILDVTASVLINTYQDKSVLPAVSDMIFKRNKKGHNIHDLVWSFFRIHDPYTLELTAKHLASDSQDEFELACRLLNIEVMNRESDTADALIDMFMKWLSENDPFLYFTGESMQFASNPNMYEIDLERKYLCQGSPSYELQNASPANVDEQKCLEVFKTLHNEEQAALADYSYQMHYTDIEKWNNWIRTPIDAQIEVVKMNRGEFV